MAHRGLGLKGGPAQRQRRRGPAAVLDVVVVDMVDAAVLQFLGPTDGFKATLLWCHGVRGVREWPAAREKRRWSFSPVMRPWRNPGVGVTRSGATELEDDLGVEAEPVRSLDGAQVRRGS